MYELFHFNFIMRLLNTCFNFYFLVDIPNFNEEFESKIRSNHGRYHRSQDHHSKHLGGNQPFAIEGNSKKEKKSSKSKH